jgi:ABC-type amino acid transport substrate-binding protein
MKKVFALLLATVMIFGLVACTPTGTTNQSTTATTAANNTTTTAAATTTQQQVRKIVYGFPGTAARLNFVNNDGTYDGYEIAIIKELDKRLDQYEFELYCAGEFSALTPGLDSNKFDMVGSNITWKKERAENYLYSEVSYFSSPYVIGVQKDNTTINSLEDLAGKHVLRE